MSDFFLKKYSSLIPYTPGEQPRGTEYIKLNTNESPFPPSESVINTASAEINSLNLYSDPDGKFLREAIAHKYNVLPEQIVLSNGSDEILDFIFMAFCDSERQIVFPDITYGLYKVFANLHTVSYREIPLASDFSVCTDDYIGIGKNIILANPNAPTGIALTPDQIEDIVKSNRNNIVVIDEAYVAFGAESCIPLTKIYNNLIVTHTFSKSHSLAGARLGFSISSVETASDLNTIRCSINPYNVNRMTLAAGKAALESDSYYVENCHTIVNNREYTSEALTNLNFDVLDSKTNFLFVRSHDISGEILYSELKKSGILVRHFNGPRISEYNRITVGTHQQMDRLIHAVENIISMKNKWNKNYENED